MITFTITRPDGDVETLKTSRTKLTVGGGYTDDITLLNRDVSPEHGVFLITGEEVVYTDNGFGTLVNDRKIVDEPISVTSEDRIVIGSVVITYVLDRDKVVLAQGSSSIKPDSTRRAPFRKTEPKQPDARTFPTRGEASPLLSPVSTTAPSRTMPTSVSTSSRPLPDMKEIEIPENQNKGTDYTLKAIIILILMILFWPLGFLVNLLVLRYGAARKGPSHNLKYVTILYIINIIVLLIVIYLIAEKDFLDTLEDLLEMLKDFF